MNTPGVVLVVDDNELFVDNLVEILTDAGYVMAAAHDASEARARAHDGFDVALIDLRLPDDDGIRLARELKEARKDAEVVLLTGHASVESAAAAVRAGACAYLVKPCATPELLLTVGQAMQQVKLRREAKELARRAQVAEKLAAVGTLTAGLSHEIRNPLNAAGLQLSVLERRIGRLDPAQQTTLLEPLRLVRDEIRRLDHILEDFLQFARPRDFTPELVDLNRLVQAVSDLLSEDARQRQVNLETHLSPVPQVRGDEGRLRQVTVNLVLNALEAAGSGGTVRLTLSELEETVELAIEDSGSGVPESLANRIFEPFFTTKAAGSGLGLSIVNAIIVQHGGVIELRPSALGGANFTVVLPR